MTKHWDYFCCLSFSGEVWDESRFLGYMEALASSGEEFATASSRIQIVHRTLLRNCDRNIGGGLEIKVDKMKVSTKEEKKKQRESRTCFVDFCVVCVFVQEMFNALDGAAYIEAVRLCCHHVAVAARLQVSNKNKDTAILCSYLFVFDVVCFRFLCLAAVFLVPSSRTASLCALSSGASSRAASPRLSPPERPQCSTAQA